MAIERAKLTDRWSFICTRISSALEKYSRTMFAVCK